LRQREYVGGRDWLGTSLGRRLQIKAGVWHSQARRRRQRCRRRSGNVKILCECAGARHSGDDKGRYHDGQHSIGNLGRSHFPPRNCLQTVHTTANGINPIMVDKLLKGLMLLSGFLEWSFRILPNFDGGRPNFSHGPIYLRQSIYGKFVQNHAMGHRHPVKI